MCTAHTAASCAYAWYSTSSYKPFSLGTGFKTVFSQDEFMCMDWLKLALDCANATIAPMAADLVQMILVSGHYKPKTHNCSLSPIASETGNH